MNWWFSAQAVEFWETILGIKQAIKTNLKQQRRTPNPFDPYDCPNPKDKALWITMTQLCEIEAEKCMMI